MANISTTIELDWRSKVVNNSQYVTNVGSASLMEAKDPVSATRV